MAEVINKSEVVRHLHTQGLSTSIISKIMGIRYNMVYNVVERFESHKDYVKPETRVKDNNKDVVIHAIAEVSKELEIQIATPELWEKE